MHAISLMLPSGVFAFLHPLPPFLADPVPFVGLDARHGGSTAKKAHTHSDRQCNASKTYRVLRRHLTCIGKSGVQLLMSAKREGMKRWHHASA